MRADRLRLVREARGYTQEELGEMIGETRLQIWRFENGKYLPKSDILIKLAKALSVSADYLLGLSDNPALASGETHLSLEEQLVIAAMRHGNTTEAIRVIVSAEG